MSNRSVREPVGHLHVRAAQRTRCGVWAATGDGDPKNPIDANHRIDDVVGEFGHHSAGWRSQGATIRA